VVLVDTLEKRDDAGGGFWTSEFGNDVGIDQVLHERSTSLPVSWLRSVSRLAPASGDFPKKSTRPLLRRLSSRYRSAATMTTAGSPSEVTVTSVPAVTSRITALSWFLASRVVHARAGSASRAGDFAW